MDQERHLQTVDQDGQIETIVVRLDTADSPATMTGTTPTENIGPITAADVLDCLTDLRHALEARGKKLCCQGARINVWPSGQLRQFTNGASGYVLTKTSTRTPDDPFEVVDLLDPAPPDQV